MRFARGLVLLLALSCAAGSALLAHRNGRMSGQPGAPDKPDTVDVLVASRAVAVAEMIGKEQVRWQPWPRNAVPAGSLRRESTSPTAPLPFQPAPARYALLEGEPLSAAKLSRAEDGSALAALVGQGMRAVSVPIREETSAGGSIQQNDRVDVIVTRKDVQAGRETHRSEILLRGAKVLAVGKGPNGKSGAPRTATLELAPGEARTLSAAQSGSEISLALIGARELARIDLPTAALGEPVQDVRVLKYGRPANRQTAQ